MKYEKLYKQTIRKSFKRLINKKDDRKIDFPANNIFHLYGPDFTFKVIQKSTEYDMWWTGHRYEIQFFSNPDEIHKYNATPDYEYILYNYSNFWFSRPLFNRVKSIFKNKEKIEIEEEWKNRFENLPKLMKRQIKINSI